MFGRRRGVPLLAARARPIRNKHSTRPSFWWNVCNQVESILNDSAQSVGAQHWPVSALMIPLSWIFVGFFRAMLCCCNQRRLMRILSILYILIHHQCWGWLYMYISENSKCFWFIRASSFLMMRNEFEKCIYYILNEIWRNIRIYSLVVTIWRRHVYSSPSSAN